MKRIYLFFALLFTANLAGQNLSRCGPCLWNDPAWQTIWQQYVLEDTASARMKIRSMRVVVTKDTASPGITGRYTNDPNCNNCRLIRYDEQGRTQYVFDNTSTDGKRYKQQYVYDDQFRPKHILTYYRVSTEEFEDTAYHLLSFRLINYFEKFTIAKDYPANGTGFSLTPRQAPVSTQTKTYDDKKRVLMDKTVYTNHPEMTDSTVYTYGKNNEVVYHRFVNKQEIKTVKRIEEDHRIFDQADSTLQMKSCFRTHYQYDSQNRLIMTENKGSQYPLYCCSDLGCSAEVRYNKDGLPLMIIFRGGGDYCALVFYYTIYKPGY
jgi:hypothetical protein